MNAEAKEFICIVCPNSCRLTVWEESGEVLVQGNDCNRGIAHGKSEYENPVRMLTTTVRVIGGVLRRLPVITSAEIPKARLSACLEALYAFSVEAPVKCGEILMQNICGTGADILASRDLKQKQA